MNGAVITALNEADTIGDLVASLQSQGLAVCVVDDGSKDATGEVAAQAGAHVIYHKTPQGIGKSLIEVWRYAISQGWEYTVQIDAGGSHDPEEAIRSAYWYKESNNKADIHIGTRFDFFSEYIGRRWRAIATQMVASLLNWTTGEKISDWTSGYRVFSRKALLTLADVTYLTNMHTWQIEVLAFALHKGLTVAEFPITYRSGNSTMKLKTVDDLIKVYLLVFNL